MLVKETKEREREGVKERESVCVCESDRGGRRERQKGEEKEDIIIHFYLIPPPGTVPAQLWRYSDLDGLSTFMSRVSQ